MLSKGILRATLHIASSLSLADAMYLLESLDAYYLEKVIYEDCREARLIVFRTLARRSGNLAKPCTQIGPIWFEGGPPGERNWVRGMVSQYVADCILRAFITFGQRVTEAKIDTVLRYGSP